MTALLSTLTPRTYAGAADLAAIAELLNLCRLADNLDDITTVEELQHEFASPDFDVQRDMRLWADNQGQLCAVTRCWLPEATEVVNGYWGFSIRPDMRNLGLEADIIAWATSRIREVAQAHQLPAKLRSGVRDDQTARLELLRRHGFTVDRHFYRMARSLSDPIPQPQFPAGFGVRPLRGEAEVAAWVELFNQSFIDHWNFHPMTVEDRLHWMTEADYNPDLDFVAVAPDGTLAAFCYNLIHASENQLTGRQEGWIADLGTRRGFRRLGLGRAMLLTGIHALKGAGMATAILGVDSENPSGALNLYQSVGFQKRYSFVSHVKPLGH